MAIMTVDVDPPEHIGDVTLRVMHLADQAVINRRGQAALDRMKIQRVEELTGETVDVAVAWEFDDLFNREPVRCAPVTGFYDDVSRPALARRTSAELLAEAKANVTDREAFNASPDGRIVTALHHMRELQGRLALHIGALESARSRGLAGEAARCATNARLIRVAAEGMASAAAEAEAAVAVVR